MLFVCLCHTATASGGANWGPAGAVAPLNDAAKTLPFTSV